MGFQSDSFGARAWPRTSVRALMDGPGSGGDWRRALIYLGGLMGPFGAGVMVPMIPELRTTFSVTTTQVGLAMTLYLLPFAGLLLVSGTLGDRWGRVRTLRWTFALYAVATAACAVAPSFAWFMVGRVGQGALNAFITPLLLATLTDSGQNLGRTVGRYAAFQAFGQVLGPIVGGVAADVNWRAAFWVAAAVSAVIAPLLPGRGKANSATVLASDAESSVVRTEPAFPSLRPLLRRPTLLLAATTMLSALGPVGARVLVGLGGRDVIGLTGSQVGLLLLGGGIAGMAAAPLWGVVLDRWGGRRAAVVALVVCSGFVALLPLARSAWVLALIWFAAGASTQAVVVGFQSLASVAAPDNRAGALSFILSLRFFGHALGAIVWLPVFAISPATAYLASAAVGILAIVAVLASKLDTRPPA